MNLQSEKSPGELRPSCTRAQALCSRIQNTKSFFTLFCVAPSNLEVLSVWVCLVFFLSSAATWPAPAVESTGVKKERFGRVALTGGVEEP